MALATGSAPYSIFIHFFSDDNEAIPLEDEVRLGELRSVDGAVSVDAQHFHFAAVVEAGPPALLQKTCSVEIQFPDYEGSFNLDEPLPPRVTEAAAES